MSKYKGVAGGARSAETSKPYCLIIDVEEILMTSFLDVIQHAKEIVQRQVIFGRNEIASAEHPGCGIEARAWSAHAKVLILRYRNICTIESNCTTYFAHVR